MPQIDPIYFAIAIAVAVMLGTSIRILKEYERAVIFRLGRLTATRGPGLVFMIPFWIERMQRISLRVIVNDVTPQDVITKDNVSVSVNAVLTFRVTEADRAVIEVEDFGFAISQVAQTTLRSVLGRAELDDLLSDREKLNEDLASIHEIGRYGHAREGEPSHALRYKRDIIRASLPTQGSARYVLPQRCKTPRAFSSS